MADFWSNNDRGYRLRLVLDQVSQNIAGNTSQVRVRLALMNTTTTFAGYTFSGEVVAQGQKLAYYGQPTMTSYNQTIWLIDKTITVEHLADGRRDMNFTASFSGSGGYSPGNLSISKNYFRLSTIPRTSSVKGQTVSVGSSMPISINRHSSSFTHTLRYGYGGSKGGVIATGVGSSYSWSIPEHFAEEVTKGTSAQGTIWCDTYSGNTKIGTSHYIFTVTVPDSIKPELKGITLSDANTAAGRMFPSTSEFVQVVSNIKVAFSGAKEAYKSPIVGYYAEIVDKGQLTTENGGTLGMMNFSGSATIRAYVVDARGKKSNVVEKSIKVLEYFPPILSFDVERGGAGNDQVVIKRRAKIAPLLSGTTQKNTMKLSFRVAPIGSNDFVMDNGDAGGTWTTRSLFDAKNEGSALLGKRYAPDKTWQVVGRLEDAFTSAEYTEIISPESYVLGYEKDGRFSVGQVPDLTKPVKSIQAPGGVFVGNDLHPIQSGPRGQRLSLF